MVCSIALSMTQEVITGVADVPGASCQGGAMVLEAQAGGCRVTWKIALAVSLPQVVSTGYSDAPGVDCNADSVATVFVVWTTLGAHTGDS